MVKPVLLVMVLAFGSMAGAPAEAADLGPMFGQQEDAGELPPQDYTFGSGWYLRGDVGWGETPKLQLGADFPSNAAKHNWDGDVGVGYRLNQWFRSDLTLGLHQGLHIASTGKEVICPYQLNGIYENGNQQNTLGYAWSSQAGTCNGKGRAFEDQAELMANGYFDLGTWYGLTPYVGAGAGLARIQGSADVDYYKTSDGSVYNPNLSPLGGYPLIWVNPTTGNPLTPQPTVPGTNRPVAFAQQNWKQAVHRKQYNFAWALMAGFAYAIDSHLAVDVGYRFLNAGPYKILPGANSSTGSTKQLTTQEVRVGLRYQID